MGGHGEKLIVLENVSSHCTPELVRVFDEKDCTLYRLPPNTTAKTQQLDVQFMSVLKVGGGRRVPRAVTTSSCARRVTAVSRARGCATACSTGATSGTAIIARRPRRYDASVNDDSFKDQTILPILLCRRVRFHPHASTSGTIVIAGNCVPTHADGENTTSSNNLTTVENGAQEDKRDRTGIYTADMIWCAFFERSAVRGAAPYWAAATVTIGRWGVTTGTRRGHYWARGGGDY